MAVELAMFKKLRTFDTPIIDSVREDAICTMANSATSIANARVPPIPTNRRVVTKSLIDS